MVWEEIARRGSLALDYSLVLGAGNLRREDHVPRCTVEDRIGTLLN